MSSKTIDIANNLNFVPDFNQGNGNLVTLSQTGVFSLLSTSPATDISTGGVLVSEGGIRVKGVSFTKTLSLNGANTNFDLNVPSAGRIGSTSISSAYLEFGSNLDIKSGKVNIKSTEAIVSISDAALVVDGGFSVAKGILSQGTVVLDVTNSEALLVRKSGDTGDIFTINTSSDQIITGVSSKLRVLNTEDSTSTTGAIQVAGGISVEKDIYAGKEIIIQGDNRGITFNSNGRIYKASGSGIRIVPNHVSNGVGFRNVADSANILHYNDTGFTINVPVTSGNQVLIGTLETSQSSGVSLFRKTQVSGSEIVQLQSTQTTGYSTLTALDNTGVSKIEIGYGNVGVSNSNLQGFSFMGAQTSTSLKMFAGGFSQNSLILNAADSSLSVLCSTTSTNTSSGAIQVAGGVGIIGNLHVGGLLSMGSVGSPFVNSTNNSTNSTTGAITLIGGVSIALSNTANGNATSVTAGGGVTIGGGGLAVGRDTYIGGDLFLSNTGSTIDIVAGANDLPEMKLQSVKLMTNWNSGTATYIQSGNSSRTTNSFTPLRFGNYSDTTWKMAINSNNIDIRGLDSAIHVTNNVISNSVGTLAIQGELVFYDDVRNSIIYNINGVAAPSFTTRSAGTKLVLYPLISGSTVDFGLGIETAHMWFSIDEAISANGFKWYAGTTQIMRLSGTGNLTIAGTVDGRDISTDGASLDNLTTTIGLSALTSAEVDQLENINSTVISTTQWGYLGAMNQSVSTGSGVTFGNISTPGTVDGRDVSTDGASLDNLTTTIGLSALTSAEVDQLENINSTVISTTQWGYLGAMNQSVSTGSDMTLNSVIIDSTSTESLLVRRDGDTGDVFSVDTSSNSVLVSSTVVSTSNSTGALQVRGGVGITESLYAQNVVNGGFDFVLGSANQVTRGNSGLSRALVKNIDTALYINYFNDFFNGTVVDSTLDVDSTSMNAFVVRKNNDGGDVFRVDTTNSIIHGFADVRLMSTTESTSITTGALTTSGGVGIVKNVHVGGNIVVTGTVDGRDVSTDGSSLDNLTTTIGLSALTSAEVDQLENINATVISVTQWGYLGAMNQSVATGSNVVFTGVTSGALNCTGILNVSLFNSTGIQSLSYTNKKLLDVGAGVTVGGHVFTSQDATLLYTPGNGTGSTSGALLGFNSETSVHLSKHNIIETTNSEALLVRKNNDGGDVFTVDTNSNIVTSTDFWNIRPTSSGNESSLTFFANNDKSVAVSGDSYILGHNVSSVGTKNFSIANNSGRILDCLSDRTLLVVHTTNSTSITTGSLKVSGGVGVVKDLYIGGNIVVTGTVDGRDVSTDGASLDNLTTTIGLSALTSAEVDQLENINSTVISTTQWGYLGAMNQSVATGSDVTLNSVIIDSTSTESLLVRRDADAGDVFSVNTTSNHVLVSSTVVSTSNTSGALQVRGGMGVTESLYAQNIVNGGFDFVLGSANQVTRGNSGLSRALVKNIDTALYINYFNDFFNGTVVDSTLDVDVTSTNAFVVRKNLDGGDVFTVDTTNSIIRGFGDLRLTSTVESTSITTGALTTTGGVGIVKNLHIGGNIVVTGTVDGRDISTDGSSLDNLTTTIGLSALTSGEVDQLENINSTVISATQWGYLGAMNQSVSTGSGVTFGNISTPGTVDGRDVSTDGASLDNLTTTIGLSALTSAEVDQLENINTTVISVTQWGYLGAMNQSVATGSDITFNSAILDSTSVTALLVRRDGNTGDVFSVNTTNNHVLVSSTVGSASSTSGALQVRGGVGINDNLVVKNGITNGGFDFYLGSTDQTTRGNSGLSRALVKNVDTSLYVNYENEFFNGTVVDSTLDVDSTSVNAFVVRKNSDGGDVFRVDTTNSIIHGFADLRLTSTTESTSITTGALTTTGGVGIVKNLHIGGNIVVTGTVDGRDVSTDGSSLDNLTTTIGLSALTSGEVDQLENINSTVISTTQWGYLGSMNQSVSTSSNVVFTGVTSGALNCTGILNVSLFNSTGIQSLSYTNKKLLDVVTGATMGGHVFPSQDTTLLYTPGNGTGSTSGALLGFNTETSVHLSKQNIIESTDIEALLVRKNNDGGDVLTVNTTNSIMTLSGSYRSMSGSFAVSTTGVKVITLGLLNGKGYMGKFSCYIGQISNGIWGAQGDLLMPTNADLRGNLSNITEYQFDGNQIAAVLQPYNGANSNAFVNDTDDFSVQVNVTTIASASTLYWTLTVFSILD